MTSGVIAAIAHFPDRGRAIEKLVQKDEEFRSLCADLADAEAALAGWTKSSSIVREDRCFEYRRLITDLAVEICHTLDRKAS